MTEYSTLGWIRSCITPVSIEQFNAAQPGEKLGLYADSTIRVSADVGTEDPEERPVAILYPVREKVDEIGLVWLLYAEFTREHVQLFSISGYEAIERTVTPANKSSGRVYLPNAWIGKRVMIVRLE
jgi:hypothetical protein